MMREEGLAGRTLAGRYDVLAALGHGGMGAVYRARDRELDEEIALKVLRDERDATLETLERFRREVKLARRVTHRNVARTFELGHADGITFCTMELVEGESLRQRLRREHQLPSAEAIAIARELCEALAAAHAAGVIHRDIKPDNVLIARDGRVVLADFGVAAAMLAEQGEIAGTVAYMAPEQARGEPPTPATDIFAVGLVLFEMVTGARPSPGVEVGDRDLARVIARATATEPLDRVGDARELARMLDALGHARPCAPPVVPDDGPAIDTVIVLPPHAVHGKTHLALGLHQLVLAQLAELPRVRAVPRASEHDEPGGVIVELAAGETATATIRRAGAPSTVLELPLAIGELETSARAIAAAAAGVIARAREPVGAAATEALELALTARELMQRALGLTPDAHALLSRANELLPDDPRIISPLAVCEVRLAFFSEQTSSERLARARNLVRAALAIGADRVEAHLAAGHLALHTGRPVNAAAHFRDAIARAPYVAEAHEFLGRMLLEAGFLDVAYDRLDVALAIAPNQGMARWELARAYALEGLWDDYDRLASELVAFGSDRWVMRLRGDLWRRDLSRAARTRAEVPAPHADITLAIAAIADTILDGAWPARRDELVAIALAPTAIGRRRAFNAQLVAEAAGYFGDVATCAEMVALAADAGAFDLHWLDRCPLLDCVRGPVIAEARAIIARRANSILDALYRDAADDEPETTIM